MIQQSWIEQHLQPGRLSKNGTTLPLRVLLNEQTVEVATVGIFSALIPVIFVQRCFKLWECLHHIGS